MFVGQINNFLAEIAKLLLSFCYKLQITCSIIFPVFSWIDYTYITFFLCFCGLNPISPVFHGKIPIFSWPNSTTFHRPWRGPARRPHHAPRHRGQPEGLHRRPSDADGGSWVVRHFFRGIFFGGTSGGFFFWEKD